MTDLVGIRIITYFHDDVDTVKDVIRREFKVDEENSVDKRTPEAVDKFGYRSLHLVVSLSDARCAFSEYSRFEKLKCEIQIRTVLQHAWAEIEHDLGYKPDAPLAPELKRRFALLSGLLEMADNEFAAIRDRQVEVEREKILSKEQDSSGLSISQNATTLIDADTIAAFVRDVDTVIHLDKSIEEARKSLLIQDDEIYAQIVSYLEALNLETLEQVNNRLLELEEQIVTLAALWPPLNQDQLTVNIPHGICIIYMMLVSIAADKNEEDFSNILQELGFLTHTPSALPNRLLQYFDFGNETVEEVAKDILALRFSIVPVL